MKTSSILSIAMISLGMIFAPAAVHADEPAIAISIAVPVPGNGDAQRFIILDDDTHFHVLLTNVSNKVQRLVADGNSTGDEALSFEITDAVGRKSVARVGTLNHQSNSLDWWVLQPGESVVLDVDALSPVWQGGFPHPATYGTSEIVTMSAVFEVKSDKTTTANKLWTGRIVSKPEKYAFENRISDPK